MSDPTIPPRPVTPGLAGTPAGVAPNDPRAEYTRTTVNVGSPPVKSGSGFATGLMVAAVFIVVAILAYGVLGNRDDSVAAPSVSIENNAAPAPAPEAPAPDAAAPEAVAPDTATPDAATPDAASPDPVVPAPDATAPDATAPAAPANP